MQSSGRDWVREFRARRADGIETRPEDYDRALAALSRKQRQAVILVHIEGLTQAEAAAELRVSQPAIAQRLYAAGKAFAELLCAIQDERLSGLLLQQTNVNKT